MSRPILAVLFALLILHTVRSDDDGWTGQWVFPRTDPVVLYDKAGKECLKWRVSAGKVIRVEKDRVVLRHLQYPGPYESYAKKSDLVLLSDAEKHFTARIQKNKMDLWAWNRRAEVRTVMGEHGKAIDDLTEIIRLAPTADAYDRRGTAWKEKGDLDKAIKDHSEAIRLDPKHAVAFCNRGEAWHSKGQYDKSIKDFDEAIRIDPKFAIVFLRRGRAWAAKQRSTRAILDYTEAIRLERNYPLAFNNRGIEWGKRGNYERAITDFDEAIRLNPTDADALYNRGVTWHRMRVYGKAIKDYEAAIRLDPKRAMPAGSLAWLLASCSDEKFRDGKRAIELATKACDLTEWSQPNLIDTLAAAYAEAGDFDNAVKYQKKAMEDTEFAKDKAARDHLKLYEARKPLRDPPEM